MNHTSPDEDPYETLELPRNATQAQIKASYRKLALRYHPDKQTNEDDKRKCSEKFAKIGNAHEILGDADRKAEYDRFGTVGMNDYDQGYNDPFSSRGGGNGFFGGFGGFGSNPFDDPFFGGRGVGGRGQHRGGFMDPFDLFRSVFSHDLDSHFNGFDDGFGSNHNAYGNMSNNRSNHGDPFGSMMGRHMDMMNSMMNMQNGGGGGSYSYSSSSSSFGGNGSSGMRESVTTSTRIINGKRQTITERTVVKPDGSVETTRETSGDDDFPSALEYGDQSNNGNNGRYLQDSSQTHQDRRGFFGRR